MPVIRLGSSNTDTGESYLSSLNKESEKNFRIILSLLSSYWQSTIDGPNYAREIKSVAIELSRIRLAMNEVQSDVDWRTTRTEFLHQFVTSFLFPERFGAPDLQKSDVDFRFFLSELVKIYFKGSIPDSIQKVMELLTDQKVVIRENFKQARNPGSGFDISDEFGFSIDILLPDPGSLNSFLLDKNVRILLSIIRPSHTLYKLRLILQDEWEGTGPTTSNNGSDLFSNKMQDSYKWDFSTYNYEDFRKQVLGVERIDELGFKKSYSIFSESHDDDF